MRSNRMSKRSSVWLALLLAGVVGLGGLSIVSPSIAAAPLNWAKIWKKQLRPKADKRYYQKAQADARFAAKDRVIRGVYSAVGSAPAAGGPIASEMSFGVLLPSAPVTHYISDGDPVPAGCSGTRDAPGAAAGHLCVFEFGRTNSSVQIIDANGNQGASRMGAWIYGLSNGAGSLYLYGSWAVGVGAGATVAKPAAPTGPPVGER